MHIAGGGGSAPHHTVARHDAPSHNAPRREAPRHEAPRHEAPRHEAPRHEAPRRSEPVRNAPTRRESPAPVHKSSPQRDTVHISQRAERLGRLMQNQDRSAQNAPKPAPQPAKKESSGGFLSGLVHRAEQTVQNVEHAASKEVKKVENKVEHAAKTVEHVAKQVGKRAETEVHHVTQKVAKVAHKVEHEAGKVVQATEREARHIAAKVSHEAKTVEHSAEKRVQNAVHTVEKNVKHVASEVGHEAQVIGKKAKQVEHEAGKAVHAVEKEAHDIAVKVNHEVGNVEHSVEKRVKSAVHTVEKGVQHVVSEVEHEAKHIEHSVETSLKNAEHVVKSGLNHVEKQAVHAYQNAKIVVEQDAHGVENTFNQVAQEAGKIGHGIEKGTENLAAHPGATLSAVGEVVGGLSEAAAGVVFGTATSETGIGALIGAGVAVDGIAHTGSGIGDLASIFNGNISNVGTHNFLEHTAENIGGQRGKEIYDASSAVVSMVIPGAEANGGREALQFVGDHAKAIVSTAKGAANELAHSLVPVGRPQLAYAHAGGTNSAGIMSEFSKISDKFNVMMAKAEEKLGIAGTKGTGKIDSTDSTATDTKLRRPYIRKAVRQEVENNTPKSPDGRFLDANTNKPINGRYDLGHKPGNEHWRESQKAQQEGLTQKQFNNKMNNPNLYHVEDPSLNRSHKYEIPK